jgi:hypothetical protein
VRILQAPGPQHGRAPYQGPIHILEERFHLTNLVRGRLHGEQLIRLDRAHWRIENDLHGSLDIQWQLCRARHNCHYAERRIMPRRLVPPTVAILSDAA